MSQIAKIRFCQWVAFISQEPNFDRRLNLAKLMPELGLGCNYKTLDGKWSPVPATFLKERIRSGLAAAKACGKALGRQVGDRPKSNKLAPKVIELFSAGNSYRKIASECQLSVNTVRGIVHRSSQEVC